MDVHRATSRFLGVAQLTVWGSFALLSWRFRLDVEPLSRPFGDFYGLLALAFGLWLLTLFLYWNASEDHLGWRMVLFWAVAMRLPLVLGSHPVQEIDYYRYLWDGRSVLAGVSPFRFSPADLDRMRSVEAPPREAATLLNILDGSPAWERIFSTIDHREVPTIYPPMSQAVFAAAVVPLPDEAEVFPRIVALRLALALFDLGIVALLLRWLVLRRLPPARAVLYAWCPLVLKEFANGAHMDVIAVFLTMAAWLLAVMPSTLERRSGPGGLWWLAWLAWGGGVLAKWYPLILAPVLLSHGWSRWRWRSLAPVGLAALSIVAIQRFSADHDEVPRGRDTEGLRTFLERWEMNDLVFSVVRENLRTPDATIEGSEARVPWYVVTTPDFRRSWADRVESLLRLAGVRVTVDVGFASAQVFAGTVLLTLAAWLSLRAWPTDPADPGGGGELGRRCFAMLAVTWYLSATQNPWYWCWALPFATFARSRLWWFVPALASIYYLRFWLIYHFPEPVMVGLSGAEWFDEVAVWFEHAPVLLLWLGCLWWERQKGWGIKRLAGASHFGSGRKETSPNYPKTNLTHKPS